MISFDGNALLWYQWENKKHAIILWEEKKILLLKQFRSTQEDSLHNQFLAIEQTSTVKDY